MLSCPVTLSFYLPHKKPERESLSKEQKEEEEEDGAVFCWKRQGTWAKRQEAILISRQIIMRSTLAMKRRQFIFQLVKRMCVVL